MQKIKKQDVKHFQLCAQRIQAIPNAMTSTRAGLHDFWDVFAEEVFDSEGDGLFSAHCLATKRSGGDRKRQRFALPFWQQKTR